MPIVLWGQGVQPIRIKDAVQTTQIAPTVLEALGLPVADLKVVAAEHTQALPGLR